MLAIVQGRCGIGSEEVTEQQRELFGEAARPPNVDVGAALAWSLARPPGDPCISAAASLAPTWNPDRREQIEAAFRGSGRPYAQSTWATIEPRMATYVQAWVEQRVGLCRSAGDPHQGHALALRHLCLEQRRDEFTALVDLLARADGEVVDNAVQAVAQLQSVVGCDDPGAHFARAPRPSAELETEVHALEQRLAELRALEQTGKYHTGVELAGAVVRDARALGQAPLVAEALYWQGLLHSRAGAPKPAELALREAALLAEESRHDPIVASAATELVRVVGVEQERHAEGVVWSDLAGAALRRVGDERGEVIRRGYLGHLHELRGELRLAQAAYSEALARAREHFPEEHPAMATALDDLAGTQLEQGEYAAAQASYEKVLQIRQATQGAGHPRVAEALGHLGRVAAEQGQQERAREMFEQALRICETLRACNPGDRAEALINLGRSEAALGRSDAAQRLHEEALALYEGLYGRDHSKIAALLVALGELTQQQGRHDEAAAFYHRALAIQRRLQPEDHPAMAAIHVDLGTLALARGRLDEARDALERALAIHHKHSGSENFELAESRGIDRDPHKVTVHSAPLPRDMPQRLADASDSAFGNDDIGEAPGHAPRHRVDRGSDFAAVACGDLCPGERRYREKVLAGHVAALLRRCLAALLDAGLAPKPAPDTEQVERCQDQVLPQQVRLVGREPEQRPCKRADREDDKADTGDSRSQIGCDDQRCDGGRDRCCVGGNLFHRPQTSERRPRFKSRAGFRVRRRGWSEA